MDIDARQMDVRMDDYYYDPLLLLQAPWNPA
jgi:hypothetical protein